MSARRAFAVGGFVTLAMIGCGGDTFLSAPVSPGSAGAAGASAGTAGVAGTDAGSAGAASGGAGAAGAEAGNAGGGGETSAGAGGVAATAGAGGVGAAAGSSGVAGSAGASGSGTAGARSCAEVAECPDPTVSCQLPACVDGLCTSQPLDAVPCGENQMCQQGVCVCACSKGTVTGMPGCLAPEATLDPAAASAVFDGKRDIAFRPLLVSPTGFTLIAAFSQPVLLSALTLDVSATGAAGKPKFAARYDVFGNDPDGARSPIGGVDVTRENGDHVLIDVPVLTGSYTAIELRISTPVPLPADAGFTDIAIYEITTNLCP